MGLSFSRFLLCLFLAPVCGKVVKEIWLDRVKSVVVLLKVVVCVGVCKRRLARMY